MIRIRFLAVTIGVTLIACDADPASEIKVIERPTRAAAGESVSFRDTASIYKWKPPAPFRAELCNLKPDSLPPGQTTFAAKGPCSFKHTANVKCRAALDDFHTVIFRHGSEDATVAVYLNIEFFNGAGNYEGGQMFLTVQQKDAYYHWGSDSVKTTVGPGMKYVDLHPTRLMGEAPTEGEVLVTGRLWCGALGEEKPMIINTPNG